MASSSSSTSHFLILSLLFFSLLAFSTALPYQTISNAAEILSESGYKSMSLTLDLASRSLISQSQSLTVFAPADAAFRRSSAQPSLNLLRYHLLPISFSLRSLKSLPLGAKISTLLAGHSLTVTTLPSNDLVSLNNVTLTADPIFNDGSLIIFGTNRFFDPYFRISGPVRSYGPKNLGCLAPQNTNPSDSIKAQTAPYYPFSEASKVLSSKGCSFMASFLEMQFHGFLKYQTMLTVFAPVDQAMAYRIGNLSEYSSLFRRHVIPCRLSWSDLASVDDGTVLKTNLEGYTITVKRYNTVLRLNGVSVILSEMYQNGWLVVHGISQVLELPESPTEETEQVLPVVDVVASSPPEDSEAFDDSSSEDESVVGTKPGKQVFHVPFSPEIDSNDYDSFSNSSTEDDAAVSHSRFFVYRPS